MQSPYLPPSSSYEILGHLWTEEIVPNYPLIQLSNRFGTATVALHGAHVVAYTPVGQEPVIFTSKQAIYSEGKAIRGGIPVCWPWFGAHPTDPKLPSHGYARSKFWAISSSNHSAESTSITLDLTVDQLQASITITLSESLEVSLTTSNISEHNQTIGGALHSYFKVSDIEDTLISGLNGIQYIDTLTEATEIQVGEISISEETDRIYTDSCETVHIIDSKWKRTITINKSGSLSTVVWNPWIEKSSNMGDLGNSEYRNFVCIEAANARGDVHSLEPGASHTLSTKITSS